MNSLSNPPGKSDSRNEGQMFLSVSQFANALGLSVRTVRREMAAGQVPNLRFGGSVRIPKLYLQNLLDSAIAKGDNQSSAEPRAAEKPKCLTDAKTQKLGGSALLIPQAKELDAVLTQLTERRLAVLKANGKPKSTRSIFGGKSPQETLKKC